MRNLTPAEIKKAEADIRECLEGSVADFIAAITKADYNDANIDEWDFFEEFIEWMSIR